MRLVLFVLAVALAVLGSPRDLQYRLAGDLNIPDPTEVAPQDQMRYEGYSDFAKSLRQSSDFTASPCDDFYNYTCQHADLDYFAGINAANKKSVIEGLKRSADGAPKWYQTLKTEYDICAAKKVSRRSGETLRRIFSKVNADLGPVFPLFEGSSPIVATPNSTRLGAIVGYLAQKFELNTLLSYKIEGNRLLIDEPKLAFPETYFTEAFSEFEVDYKASIKDYLQQLSEVLGKAINSEELDETVQKVVKLEKDLANLLAQAPNMPPSQIQLAQLMTSGESINFSSYFSKITKNSDILDSLMTADVKVYLAAPTKLSIVQKYVGQADPVTVLNYLNARLARSLRKYFVRNPKECVADQWLREGRGVKYMGIVPPMPQKDPYLLSQTEERCVDELFYMEHALDRVYLDQNLPDKKKRKEFVDRIKVISKKVINGFRFQIDQLSWFSPKVKAAAYKKIDAMLYNVVYDDWIESDDRLNKLYKKLINDQDLAHDDELTTAEKLRDFAQSQAWQNLLEDGGRNANFTRNIRTVNAWYHPTMNHFYIPLGILQRPLFGVNYPAAVQYGGIGYVVGHELTHGFDTNGVEFDDQGQKIPWMDAPSKAKFNEMAACVIAEYDKLHGRGKRTQTEDIADNGGLRAAHNSFKAEQALNGRDPQLPGKPLNKLTPDQLFFLGFAHVWCSDTPEKHSPWDFHSPHPARVLGTIQNFPAFRAAYNCPVGSAYAPKEHCDVWASEVKI